MTALLRAIAQYHFGSRREHVAGHVQPPNFREAARRVRSEHAGGAALLEAYDRGEAKIVGGKLRRV
jgi:hypothetical protein